MDTCSDLSITAGRIGLCACTGMGSRLFRRDDFKLTNVSCASPRLRRICGSAFTPCTRLVGAAPLAPAILESSRRHVEVGLLHPAGTKQPHWRSRKNNIAHAAGGSTVFLETEPQNDDVLLHGHLSLPRVLPGAAAASAGWPDEQRPRKARGTDVARALRGWEGHLRTRPGPAHHH
eukprot:scaffold56386_cov68-Phaeocystis_antarctica.AAC.4